MKKNKETVLVVAAHPDDEILGCGGTIAQHAVKGDEVFVLLMAEGLTSRGVKNKKEILALQNKARKANQILGVRKVFFGGLPDNKMDTIALLDIAKIIEHYIFQLYPSIIYTHHESDLNQDHQQTNQAAFIAARPELNSTIKKIFLFEIPSSTGWANTQENTFKPVYFHDIKDTLSLKLKALHIYDSEMRPWPHARSYKAIDHLARFRGSSVSLEAAESFSVGRIIQTY